jgi:hypothetical protein
MPWSVYLWVVGGGCGLHRTLECTAYVHELLVVGVFTQDPRVHEEYCICPDLYCVHVVSGGCGLHMPALCVRDYSFPYNLCC